MKLTHYMKINTYALILLLMASSCNPYQHVTKLSSMSELKYDYPVHFADLSNGIKLAYTDEARVMKPY